MGRFWRKKGITASLSPLVAFLIALVVYWLTLAPDLTWSHFGGDGGELITAAVTLGIPHPPGYPTYTLLGKLVSLVPIGSIAHRFNLFSAVAVALAASVVSLITVHCSLITVQSNNRHVSRFTPRASHSTFHASPFTLNIPSLAAGLTFAFAPLVWSQAIITEVYGLNLLFLALFLWALLTKRPSFLTGLLLGLSITTHLTSLLMLPLTIILTPHQKWFKLGLGLLFGLTPFLLLPWLAHSSSPIIWGQPTTLSGWWWLVSARIYQPNLALPAPAQILTRFTHPPIPSLLIFTLALIIFTFLLSRHGRQSPNLRPPFNLRLTSKPATSHLSIFLTASLYLLYATLYQTIDAVVLLLPAMLLLCLLLASALRPFGWGGLVLPLALLLINFNGLNLSHEKSIKLTAVHALANAPEQAIVLTPGNETIFTLWYLQHVEGQRPDLILVDDGLFAFNWYRQRLAAQYPNLIGLTEDDLPHFQQVNENNHPFYALDLKSE